MSAEVRPAIAEIRATHFGPEGQLIDKTKPEAQNPKQQQERKGWLGGLLGKLRKEELSKAEGPKHVLETIEQVGLLDKMQVTTERLHKIAEDDVGFKNGENEYYDARLNRVNLGEIDRRRIERGGETTPLVKVPDEVSNIIESLNKAAGQSEGDSIRSIALMSFMDMEVKTANGIIISLRLPQTTVESTPGNVQFNHIRLHINASALGNNPELLKRISDIETQFSDQASLLNISEVLLKYAEDVVDKLPEENKTRVAEREKEEKERQEQLERSRQEAEGYMRRGRVNNKIRDALKVPQEDGVDRKRVESEVQFKVLSERDQRYLDESIRNIMIKILENYPDNLPDAVILPDTSATPLADVLRPVFAAIAQKRGLDKVPELIPFKPLRKDEDYSAELDPEEASGEIDGKTLESRTYHKQKASEISERLKAEHPDRKPSIIIVDDYANDQTLTTKTIRNAFGRRDISAYPLLSSGENGGYDRVYEGLVDPYSAGARFEQKIETAAAGSESARVSFSLEDGGLDRNSQGFDFRSQRLNAIQQYMIDNPDSDTSLTTEERVNKVKELPQFSYQNIPGISHDMALIGSQIAQDILQAA
ncbi:hypothetical protein HYW44_02800, partial [Candidatus Daviesbacteria bacterium]|nr:hypothetical protein [Candidatus Daviesbacteria bacterium]